MLGLFVVVYGLEGIYCMYLSGLPRRSPNLGKYTPLKEGGGVNFLRSKNPK